MKIKQKHLIDSIFSALQYISYYHSPDFIRAMVEAYEKESNVGAKNAIGQILINSKMCAFGKRPLCQDTGIVNIFLEVGMDVQWDAELSVDEMINEGVRKAYTHPDNPLRASVVSDPIFSRVNTKDNTPAVIHTKMVKGDKLDVIVAAKGCGSENKAKFTVLNPDDNLTDWILKTVPTMGAGWCPPGILGIGVGGTPEKAMLMAKASLMDPIDINEVRAKDNPSEIEKLRLDLFEKVNNLGIGAQGLGGWRTVLDVKIMDYPTHAASLPVAMIPNCAATRHAHFVLDGTGASLQTPPSLSDWPEISWEAGDNVKRVNLNTVTKEDVADLKPGDTVLLSGKMLTGRDAAHKKMVEMLANGEELPVDLKGRFIYYVGPVDPVRDEVVGPAGPTTATRMDKFTHTMLDKTGLLGMIGKAERGQVAIDAIKEFGAVYLMAVGGAAYLVSKAVKNAKVVAFPEMGMEAIYEFDVEDMPVSVAVDASGSSVHQTAPAIWHDKIIAAKSLS